jgi:hypothetical protein
MPSVLRTRPARRVKRKDRQSLVVEPVEIARFQALHDRNVVDFEADAVGNLLQTKAAPPHEAEDRRIR